MWPSTTVRVVKKSSHEPVSSRTAQHNLPRFQISCLLMLVQQFGLCGNFTTQVRIDIIVLRYWACWRIDKTHWQPQVIYPLLRSLPCAFTAVPCNGELRERTINTLKHVKCSITVLMQWPPCFETAVLKAPWNISCNPKNPGTRFSMSKIKLGFSFFSFFSRCKS